MLGSILVVFAHTVNSTLWLLLVPAFGEIEKAIGAPLTLTVSGFINFARLVREHRFFSLPALIGLAVAHLWMIWQPNSKHRIAVWLLGLMVFFFVFVFFAFVFQCKSDIIMLDHMVVNHSVGSH